VILKGVFPLRVPTGCPPKPTIRAASRLPSVRRSDTKIQEKGPSRWKRHRQSFSLRSTAHVVARWHNNSGGRSTWPSWPRGNAGVAVEEIEITPEMLRAKPCLTQASWAGAALAAPRELVQGAVAPSAHLHRQTSEGLRSADAPSETHTGSSIDGNVI
jgi:hypothetical protein